MRTPSQIAYRAAEIITAQGMQKGMLGTHGQAVCLNGAVLQAAHEPIRFDSLMKGSSWCSSWETLWDTSATTVVYAAMLVLQRRGYSGDASIVVEFNDDPHTTVEDAALLLKEAGKMLEEGSFRE